MKINYLHEPLSAGFTSLFTGRVIQFVGDGLMGLFLPIYLLTKLNYSIELVFIYYLIGHLIYVLLLPIGGRALNQIGLRRSLRISVFFTALFYN